MIVSSEHTIQVHRGNTLSTGVTYFKVLNINVRFIDAFLAIVSNNERVVKVKGPL